MVNDRTIITEIGFCLGILNWFDSNTMPQIEGMDESLESVYENSIGSKV